MIDFREIVKRVDTAASVPRTFCMIALVGYGIHFTVVSFIGWPGSASLFSGNAESDASLSPFMLGKNASFCLSFFLWFLIAFFGGDGVRRSMSRKPLCVIPSLCVLCGVCLSLTPLGISGISVFEVIRGVLLGMGISGNFVLFWVAICSIDSKSAALGLVGGTALGPTIGALCSWAPDGALRLLVAVATVACGAILVVLGRGSSQTEDIADASWRDGGETREGAIAMLNKGILSLLVPTVVISALGLIMQVARLYLSYTKGDILNGSPLGLGLVMSAVLTWLIYSKTGFRTDTDIYRRWGIPLAALGLVAFALSGYVYQSVFVFVLYVVFSMASIDLILASSQSCRFYAIPLIVLCPLLFGIIYTARFIPTIFSPLQNVFFAGGGEWELRLSFWCLVMLFAVYVFASWYDGLQRKNAVFTWVSKSDIEAEKAHTMRRFDAFASCYGFTNRESEVAQMYTEGRSIPYIAERLCISESTVKYHTRNIYTKAGVATRQEFLDSYESFAADYD